MQLSEIIELLKQIDERLGYWDGYAFNQPEHIEQGNELSLEIEKAIELLEKSGVQNDNQVRLPPLQEGRRGQQRRRR